MPPRSRHGRRSRLRDSLIPVFAVLAVAGAITVWVHAANAESAPPQSSAPQTTAPVAPAAAARTVDPAQWRQIEGDEFDGTAVNTANWVVYSGVTPKTGEHWTPSLCTEGGGILTLHGVPGKNEELCGMAWQTDRVYGRWMVRMRMPKPANPQYPMMALLWPENDSDWPAAGEIDYAEEYDPGRASIEGWLHFGRDNSSIYAGQIPVDTSQWHTYGVEWEPDHISFFIDDRVTFTTTDPEAVPTGPMHETLQLNSNRSFREVDVPTEMQVDWLRIYAP